MFAACKRALPHLRKTRGNIINMSSLVGAMGQLHATTYVATKGAITAFTKALAVDEAAHDVRVNSVSPGNVYTPLWQEAIDAAPDPARCRADGDAAQLLGRMGTIEEAGRLCLFLAAEATFTTGVDHILSGGAELALRAQDAQGLKLAACRAWPSPCSSRAASAAARRPTPERTRLPQARRAEEGRAVTCPRRRRSWRP